TPKTSTPSRSASTASSTTSRITWACGRCRPSASTVTSPNVSRPISNDAMSPPPPRSDRSNFLAPSNVPEVVGHAAGGRPLASPRDHQGGHPMPELAELVDPRHTAVLTMELQRGVSGDLATLPTLAQELKDTGVIAAV